MAHLLMIESWMLSTGMALPRAIRRLGHDYTLLCRRPERYAHFRLNDGPHPASALAREIVQVDTNNASDLVATARAVHSRRPVAGVVTTCDHFLVETATLARALGLPGPDPDAVATANRKDRMREAMAAAGLPGPDFQTVRDPESARGAAAALGYPLVIKPVNLCSGIGVRRVHDDAELDKAWRWLQRYRQTPFEQPREPEVLLESVLPGEEVSVETATHRGHTRVIGITDKRLGGESGCVEVGHMFPAPLSQAACRASENMVIRALAATGYRQGTAHTEVRLTPAGPRIVEINTRAAGNWISELVRHVTGDDLLEAMVCLSMGQDWRPSRHPQGQRSAAIRFALPPRAGVIEHASGWEGWATDDAVVDWLIRPGLNGRHVHAATDNDHYLAYVMCLDEAGQRAAERAERQIERFRLEFREATEANRA